MLVRALMAFTLVSSLLHAQPTRVVLLPNETMSTTLQDQGVNNSSTLWVRGDYVSIPPSSEITPNLTLSSSPDWSAPHAPDRLLIKFQPETTAAQRDALHEHTGATLDHRFRLIDADVVTLPEGIDVRQVAERYLLFPHVVLCEPDLRIGTKGVPQDEPLFDEQWALANDGSLPDAVAGADIHAEAAWEITQGDPETIVAVIDTGVNYFHPDFSGQLWLNPGELGLTPGVDDDGNGYIDDVFGYDFADDDTDPNAATFPGGFHGSVVAGNIAGDIDEGKGITGVAPRCLLMPLKIFPDTLPNTTPGSEPFYLSYAMEAIEYATLMGADVLNNSWGDPNDLSPWTAQTITLFRELVQATADAGLIFVAAAGGTDLHLDGTTHLYPATLPEPNILSVGATSWDDGGWYLGPNAGTNYGLEVDLSAPGHDIIGPTYGDAHAVISGSSVAAPFVSGVAALLKSENPWAGWPEIKQWILDGVDTPANLADNPNDPGIPFNASGGRLNAEQSLLISGPPWLVPDNFGSGIAVLIDTEGVPLGTWSANVHSHGIISDPVTLEVIAPGSAVINSSPETAIPIESVFRCFGRVTGHQHTNAWFRIPPSANTQWNITWLPRGNGDVTVFDEDLNILVATEPGESIYKIRTIMWDDPTPQLVRVTVSPPSSGQIFSIEAVEPEISDGLQIH